MKFLSSAIWCILFVTAVWGQSSTTETTTVFDDSTTAEPTSTTAEPTSTTAEPTSTTAEPTSTTVEPTTSTPVAPTTSTPVAPTTTTVAPTTTTPVASTTTAVPTSTGAPSTTKAPEPPSTLPDCAWNVTQNNVTCIRAELKALFTIPIAGRNEYVVLFPNATTEGSDCHLSNYTQRLVLRVPNYYTLTLIFAKDGNKVFVNETTFEYTLPEGSGSGSSDTKLFSVKAGKSYLCNTEDTLKLENVTMKYENVHVEAFGAEGDTNFAAAEECEADDKVSDAIPIAVGCALAALILVVLIAYLVGRRQSRQRGYQSV